VILIEGETDDDETTSVFSPKRQFPIDRFWRKAAIEVQIIRSEWFLLAGSYLVSPMMDWNESLSFINS
jgi:hypothetical protein